MVKDFMGKGAERAEAHPLDGIDAFDPAVLHESSDTAPVETWQGDAVEEPGRRISPLAAFLGLLALGWTAAAIWSVSGFVR